MRDIPSARGCAITALALALSLNAGCSWLFVQTPSNAGEACTKSELAPTVDTVYGFQFATSAVGSAVLAGMSPGNPGLYAGVAAGSAALAGVGLGSAAYGFKQTSWCHGTDSAEPPRSNYRSTRDAERTGPNRSRSQSSRSVSSSTRVELPPLEGARTCLSRTCMSPDQCLSGDLCVESKCLSTDCVGKLGRQVAGHVRGECGSLVESGGNQ